MKIYLPMKKFVLKSGFLFIFGLILLDGVLSERAAANPVGPSVIAGGAAVSGVGTNQVIINQTTPQAILQWQQFNIAPNEVTRFIQPSAQAIALNRIFDANPSQILGSLQANGIVFLLNPNGVLFGAGAQVNVSGLVASSLDLKDEDFLSGQYRFGINQGSSVRGSVTNMGTIEAGPAGAYLFAPSVSNSGIIRSPEGEILLAAGTSVYLSQRPDGSGLLWEVSNMTGEAANLGSLIADGGRIGLSGRTVRQAGLIQANSVREKNGQIEFFASEQLSLNSGSRTIAKGDNTTSSAGGTVIARSDKSTGGTDFQAGAVIDVSGGSTGGDGGSVELGGHVVTLGGSLNGTAKPGFHGGTFLLDVANDLTVDETLFENIFSNQTGMAEITFQSDHNIHVDQLNPDPSILGGWATEVRNGIVRFKAGNDLLFTDSLIFDGLAEGSAGKWKFVANAGEDITFQRSIIAVGNGGGIDVAAERDILLIDQMPSDQQTYLWLPAGGTMNLHAGRDLSAPIAFDNTQGFYSGIRLDAGEKSDQVGALTINVGRNFIGGTVDNVLMGPSFILANGTATVTVGGDFGQRDPQGKIVYGDLTFGKGTISIQTGGDLYLGLIQDKGISENDPSHRLAFDPGNQVMLTSTNGDIHLRPVALQYTLSSYADLTEFYPASFQAQALQGSIFIEHTLSFWPSLSGRLDFEAMKEIQGVVDTVAGAGITPIQIFNIDPQLLIGRDPRSLGFQISDRVDPTSTPLQSVAAHQAQDVVFKTQTGDISGLRFRLYSPSLLKNVTISAGRDLKQFTVQAAVQDEETAAISAGRDMDLTKVSTPNGGSLESGITFYGTGIGSVQVGRNLDLSDSQGIIQRLIPPTSTDSVLKGRIDLAVGGDILMTQSRIWTYNGASINIHGLAGTDSPVGGLVNVGINGAEGNDRGIVTLRGGDIDIKATGDVNVNASRVATIAGGDIRVTSTKGNINAGVGSPNDSVEFRVDETFQDDKGQTHESSLSVLVPGSGIFTFHPGDPQPLPPYPPKPALVIPPFQPLLPSPPPQPTPPPFPDKTPKMIQLEREILKQRVFGHDTSKLEEALSIEFQKQIQDYKNQVQALFDQYQTDIAAYKQQAEASYQSQLQAYKLHVAELQAEANQQYEAIKAEHRKDWKLGDIELTAKEKSVIVPPAGIRGKKITIVAKTLDLQGGEIGGDTNVTVDQLIGDQGAIKGPGDITVGNQNITEIQFPSLPTFTLPTLPTFSLPSIPTGGSSGSASLGGLSGSSGSISSATSGSVTAASTAMASVQEKVAEQTRTEEPTEESAGQEVKTPTEASSDHTTASAKDKKGTKKYRTLQIRRGVVIQVEVQEEQ